LLPPPTAIVFDLLPSSCRLALSNALSLDRMNRCIFGCPIRRTAAVDVSGRMPVGHCETKPSSNKVKLQPKAIRFVFVFFGKIKWQED
jgi:hypothetical protein